jgi:hypothetical protein
MVVRKRERFPLARRAAAVGSLKRPSREYPATTRMRRFRPFGPAARRIKSTRRGHCAGFVISCRNGAKATPLRQPPSNWRWIRSLRHQ